MEIKYQDKNGLLLQDGDYIKDNEGIYKVKLYNFYGDNENDLTEYCIEGKKCIFPLSQFATKRQSVDLEKLVDFEKVEVCSICGKVYTGWGNNAYPINNGRCCDKCNDYVIYERIKKMYSKKESE